MIRCHKFGSVRSEYEFIYFFILIFVPRNLMRYFNSSKCKCKRIVILFLNEMNFPNVILSPFSINFSLPWFSSVGVVVFLLKFHLFCIYIIQQQNLDRSPAGARIGKRKRNTRDNYLEMQNDKNFGWIVCFLQIHISNASSAKL